MAKIISNNFLDSRTPQEKAEEPEGITTKTEEWNMKKESQKLYYEEENGGFYWVKKTSKTIKIDWVKKYDYDGSELDQNVRWKNLVVRYGGKHAIKQNDEEGILIYPFQAGQPFYLVPATKTHITSEIADCVQLGISSEYYSKLLKLNLWKK